MKSDPQLRAYERFLHDYPEWAHKVVLMQVTSPSPGDSPALATKVSELVDQINGTYGTIEHSPVHHFHQTVDRDVSFDFFVSLPFEVLLTLCRALTGILRSPYYCRHRSRRFSSRRYEHD